MIVALLAPVFAAPPVAPAPPAPVDPPALAAPAGPDRSAPPPVGEPPVLPLAEPEIHELAPGVVAKFVRVPGVRKVAVDVILDAGMVDLDGRRTPVAEGAGWLADAAAGPYGAAALSELLDLHAIEAWSYVGSHQSGVNLRVPVDELPIGLEVLGHVLRAPAYPKAELKRWKLDQELFFTVEGPSSQATLAQAAMTYAWFPADHPYGARPEVDGYGGVDLDALAARWARATKEAPITVLAAGDVPWETLAPALGEMVASLGTPGPAPAELAFDGPSAGRVVIVDLPGQSQVAVRARWKAPARSSAEAAPFVIVNHFLGGAFLSRLNSNLREEKGYTYGARTGYSRAKTYGTFTVQVDVKAENLAETVTEIRKEIHRIGVEEGTADELTSARRSIAADWNRTLETADSAIAAYANAEDDGRSMAQLRAWTESVAAVGLADVQATAARWLADDAPAVWVLVGDAAAIQSELSPLGITGEVVAPAAAMIGAF